MKYCFGVDVGGTSVKMGLFSTEGELLDKWEIKTNRENQGEKSFRILQHLFWRK